MAWWRAHLLLEGSELDHDRIDNFLRIVGFAGRRQPLLAIGYSGTGRLTAADRAGIEIASIRLPHLRRTQRANSSKRWCVRGARARGGERARGGGATRVRGMVLWGAAAACEGGGTYLGLDDVDGDLDRRLGLSAHSRGPPPPALS